MDCQDTRCIIDRANACCDDNGCSGDKVCNGSNALCGCPGTAPRDCGNNVCIPNAQCCNCTGPCQTCNNGTCGTVANGQAGRCGAGQVCQNGSCVLNDVGLGQQCSTAANNCSVGSCVAGTCQCSGNNPNACGGNGCVNFQTDGANCGGCGVNCGNLGCNGRGQCNCPAGQTSSAGSCRLNDGQACTPGGGTPCLNGCTQWFTDGDGDGFGNPNTAINRCGTTPPAGGRFVRQGGDCCDTDAQANPGQTASFATLRGGGCAGPGGDFNCDGREDKSFRSSTGGGAFDVRSGFATCADFGAGNDCSSIRLIWLGGQAPPCGTTGTGASQCLSVDGVCQSISGAGVDVLCR